MSSEQGTLDLLNSTTAQKLLQSTEMAQLAYVWNDGTPRVVPIWFNWNGSEIVVGSPPTSPKVNALRQNPAVALTINSTDWPYDVLLICGNAEVEMVDGVVPEYAVRQTVFGAERGDVWTGQVDQMFTQMARIVIRPEWVGTLDFEPRFQRN